MKKIVLGLLVLTAGCPQKYECEHGREDLPSAYAYAAQGKGPDESSDLGLHVAPPYSDAMILQYIAWRVGVKPSVLAACRRPRISFVTKASLGDPTLPEGFGRDTIGQTSTCESARPADGGETGIVVFYHETYTPEVLTNILEHELVHWASLCVWGEADGDHSERLRWDFK